MSILLPAKVIDRFSFAASIPEDIIPHISIDAIPIGYSGKKVIPGMELPTGVNPAKKVAKDEYLVRIIILGFSTTPKKAFTGQEHK